MIPPRVTETDDGRIATSSPSVLMNDAAKRSVVDGVWA